MKHRCVLTSRRVLKRSALIFLLLHLVNVGVEVVDSKILRCLSGGNRPVPDNNNVIQVAVPRRVFVLTFFFLSPTMTMMSTSLLTIYRCSLLIRRPFCTCSTPCNPSLCMLS
ncbi:uncharacterized protein EV420DRAFT_1548193 [Desarmillaria tabescens]|uniref:Secreted protein n=1 Tax=Armillaria tabescens TaxID=1929756 RepID=A0AA39KAJ4_ARMTA|nr:uncharacterized protein EV420DRAFT_1548193 [Desarmillaria tabescens]KAK0457437.1 hypothetical protein EV420DRAFT_1548193 [Desarmillaria tabescens]